MGNYFLHLRQYTYIFGICVCVYGILYGIKMLKFDCFIYSNSCSRLIYIVTRFLDYIITLQLEIKYKKTLIVTPEMRDREKSNQIIEI